MLKIKNSIANLKFRMNLRKTFKSQPIEFIIITKEEATNEIERRHKRKNT